MHETGVIHKLILLAQAEATQRKGTLRSIEVRLGALAGGSPEHLRAHFVTELERLGHKEVRLDIRQAPDDPVGVEIVSIEIAR